MTSVGFLGCGKIGKEMVRHLRTQEGHSVAFVQSPNFVDDFDLGCPIVRQLDESVCQADLVVECATADVLKQHSDFYLRNSDMLVFSVTAFSDDAFAQRAKSLCQTHGTHLYIPHGAILGLDGICDARPLLKRVTIDTIKSPASLGRGDNERQVVYDGPTRGACVEYPRNVNVHAAVAIAGIGFDDTQSRIISDPAVTTNSHTICVEGDGISFRLEISSTSSGGITGRYTPVSACGSLNRVLGGGEFRFV